MAASSMPMTPLGARALNHHSDDAEREHDRLRHLARSERDKMQSCFDRAHQAYERGDGAEAHDLSEQGKGHKAQRAMPGPGPVLMRPVQDAYNKQASEHIFRENNAPGRVAEDTIDLHGQFVEEAEDMLEMRIRDAQARGQSHLHVIVGKGNHSAGHVQKIKPRVEKVCRELGLDFATEDNAGRIYVDLEGNKVDAPPPLPPQPGGHQGGHQGGYASGGHPGEGHHGHSTQQDGQQQDQQQPPRPSQRDRLDEVAAKCFKGCCVVM